MPDEQQDIRESIQEAVTEPKSIAMPDGVSITNRSVNELIDAQKFLNSQEAAKDVIGSSVQVGRIKGRSAR